MEIEEPLSKLLSEIVEAENLATYYRNQASRKRVAVAELIGLDERISETLPKPVVPRLLRGKTTPDLNAGIRAAYSNV